MEKGCCTAFKTARFAQSACLPKNQKDSILFKVITRMKLLFRIIEGITVTAFRGLPNELALQ